MARNQRYNPENTLSLDDKGKASQEVVFRESKLLDTLSITNAAATKLPASWFRTSIILYNGGSAAFYLGDSTVLTTNGIPVAAGEKFVMNFGSAVDIYAISGESGGVEVRAWEVG